MRNLYDLAEEFAANMPLFMHRDGGMIAWDGVLVEWAPDDAEIRYKITTHGEFPEDSTVFSVPADSSADVILWGLGMLLHKHVEKISEDPEEDGTEAEDDDSA